MRSVLEGPLADRVTSPCHGATLDADSTCSDCGRGFPTASGQPVLVDFENSVLDAGQVSGTAAASLVPRSGGGRLRRLWDAENPVAEAHVATMSDRLERGSDVLVVGGATVGKGTGRIYEAARVTSFDIYASEHTNLVADAHRIPFADGTFDAVIVQAVLEHVLEPATVVGEIWRVLKPGGLVYAETPFMQQVHEGAYDFTRFTDSGHRWLFRNFEAIESGVVAGPAYAMLWTIDYLVRALTGSRRAGLRARKVVTPVRLLEGRGNARQAIDSASAVFFFGRRAETAMTPREAIAYYQGAQ